MVNQDIGTIPVYTTNPEIPTQVKYVHGAWRPWVCSINKSARVTRSLWFLIHYPSYSYSTHKSPLLYTETHCCKYLCLMPASCSFLAWLTLQPWRWKRYVSLKRRLTFTGLRGGSGGIAPPFLTSAQAGGEWWASHARLLYPGGNLPPGINWIGG
jgi:hypothetical protein